MNAFLTIPRELLGDRQIVVYVTGGGTGIIPALLEQGGGSKFLLEARVPYATAATDALLGRPPEIGYCSPETARALAVEAREKAVALGAAPVDAVGLGITASLAYAGQRHGRRNRAYVAVHDAYGTVVHSFEYSRVIPRDRTHQEGALVLDALRVLGGHLAPYAKLPAYSTSHIEFECGWATPEEQAVDLGEASLCAYVEPVPLGRPVIFPGAFNPLHEGHHRVAAQLTHPFHYEVSLRNVAKPTRDWIEVARLREQFAEIGAPWVLTNAPTFDEKVDLFPGAIFVVGADTWERINDPAYYGGNMALLHGEWNQNSISFWVYPRAGASNIVDVDTELWAHLITSFDPGPPISSTALRKLFHGARG